MADKKNDPHAIKPNNKLPFIAGGMMIFAFLWLIYDINPGQMIRTETEQEKRERAANEKDAEAMKKAAARQAAKEANRVK